MFSDRARTKLRQPNTQSSGYPILFVHAGHNWIRGSERVILDLLANLDPQRFSRFVLCNSRSMYEAVKALGVSVELRQFPVKYRELMQLTTACKIRLIHSACASPVPSLLPVARSLRIPLLAHLQTVYPRQLRYAHCLHQATLIAGVSDAALQGLREDGMLDHHLRVVHNGVDPARLEAGDASSLRKELGIPSDAIVCGFVGALTPEKSVSTLLEASCLLPDTTHFIIVGEGPERGRLERLAQQLMPDGRIHFLGKSQHVGAIFRDVIDICVLPSVQEGFPLVLIEAAYFGVPAVATNVGGVREAVCNEVTGLVVPPQDSHALAAALRRLVTSHEERHAMAQAARQNAQTKFLISNMVSSFEAIYGELLSLSSRGLGWTGNWNLRPYIQLASHLALKLLRPRQHILSSRSS